MISVTRNLARQLRSVLRRAGTSKNNRPTLQLESTGRDLFVRAQLPSISIEYREDSFQDTETLLLPVEALELFDGKSTESVTFVGTTGGVEASWEDGRIPRRKCCEVPSTALTVPDVDWSKSTVVPGLIQALAHASQCAGTSHGRYDTHLVQLRGKAGEVIATDGRQALVQSGFTFPWQEDLLVPCAAVFTARELPSALPATVCTGKTHLGMQVGDWTIYLAIDSVNRFPDVAKVIPRETSGATTLRLSPVDAEFLGKTLDKLPGNNQENSPITIDLNGPIAVRAKEEGQSRPTEVLLTDSVVIGTPVRFQCDRRLVARAINLHFAEFTIHEADKPIVCKDSTRTFIWVPLPKGGAIPPSDDAIRIVSQENSTNPQSLKERMSPPMPSTTYNGHHQVNGASHKNGESPSADTLGNGGSTNGSTHTDGDHISNGTTPGSVSFGSLIAEAQSLRDYLHDGHARASRLCNALKRHRKQSKLVSSTLASLRQLQQIEG